MQRDMVVAGELDGAQVQHAGPGRRHLEHLLVRHLVQEAGLGHDARVGRVDASHVGVDLADVGREGGGHGHRRRVGGTPSERGDVAGLP